MTTGQTKRAMNLAIDHQLSEGERQELHAHLDRTPKDARLWARMRRADRLLRSASMVDAPEGFAQRFMDTLASGRQPTRDTRLGLGIALGMLAVALTAIPILALMLIALVALLTDGATTTLVVARMNELWHELVTIATTITSPAAELVRGNTLAIGMLILSVPVIVLWAMVMRGLEQERRVTYRIPVRAAAA
jgi:anti-sigma factor RsiW